MAVKTSKKRSGKCNALPTVWAAIVGCTGERSKRWEYVTGNYGKTEVVWFCPACEEHKQTIATIKSRKAYQDYLQQLQKEAGVVDYRTQAVTRVNGVPTLKRK